MSLFSFNSIKDKLITITMISCVIALVVAGSAMILYSWDSHKKTTVSRLYVLADVLGDRSRAALVFDDDSLVTENLQSLAYEPGVLLACIYSNKKILAGEHLVGEYTLNSTQRQKCSLKPIPAPADESFHYDAFGNLFIQKDILLEDENLGSISITFDNRVISQKILFDTVIILFIILLGITVAYILIRKLQKYISLPIARLSQTARQISERHDTSIRARRFSNDETGILVSAFNNMLDTIHETNNSLTQVKNNYLALYDKNPMMLFTLDTHGSIISVNEYGAMHLGRKVDDLVSTNFNRLIFESDIEICNTFILNCLDNDDAVQRKEIRIIDINNKIIWTRSTARCIVNNDGQLNILMVCEDITEQKKLSEKLSFQASHDALTGLVNRREFEQRIYNAIEKAQQEHIEHALFFLDLDQFKVINDTCGHLAGDHLLRELVTLINPLIRQGDTLARIGGDEFGVLLENCALNQATHVAEQIRQKIYEYRFIWDEKELGIGVSIGVVPINENTSSLTIAMSDADAACYIAKESGRNKIHTYQHGDEDIAIRHGEMTWVNTIQAALNNDRFILMAQEITTVDAAHSQNTGIHYEILIRMLDDNGDHIMPGQFLPAAERYNLSPEIDRWVVTNTFKWLSENLPQLEKLELCSINLSGNTLSDDSFSDFLLQQFVRYRIPSEKICFEITETAAIANLDIAQRFIHSFSNELRCKFSLDDFGTGLSSFAYLKSMPVDFIKIDGQFVRDITSDQIDMAMVRSINEIGQIMGKKTIAEFVENEQILNQLKLIGIDYVQGYHISKPVQLDSFGKQPQAGYGEA